MPAGRHSTDSVASIDDTNKLPHVELSFQTDATVGASHGCSEELLRHLAVGQFDAKIQKLVGHRPLNLELGTSCYRLALGSQLPSFKMTDKKRAFFSRWVLKVAALGFLDFALIPVAYLASARYGSIATVPLLLAKGTLWLVGEVRLTAELRKEARLDPGSYIEVLKAFAELDGPYVGVCGHCACSFRTSFFTTIANIPEAVDSVLDATIAGVVTKVIDANIVAAFATSWQGKWFGIGNYVAAAGIDGMLIGIVIFSASLQGILFVVVFIIARRGYVAEGWLSSVTVMAEASSLKSLVDVFLRISGCYDHTHIVSAAEHHAFWKMLIKGIVENIPTAWMQASVMGLMLVFADLDRLSVLITMASISTSLGTMLSTVPRLYSFIIKIIPSVFNRSRLCVSTSSICFDVFDKCLPLVAIVVFGVIMVTTVVHAFGILLCPEHNFEFAALGCTRWTSQ